MKKSEFKIWVNQEVAKKLDREPFSSLPLRMRIGILIMLGSSLVGNGTPLALLLFSRINHQSISTAGVAKGSVLYVFCYCMGTMGLFLAGRDSIKYPIYFFAKFCKGSFPKFFESENESESQANRD